MLLRRLLEPFEWFGLLKNDGSDEDWFGPGVNTKFRKAQLFNCLLSFSWTP